MKDWCTTRNCQHQHFDQAGCHKITPLITKSFCGLWSFKISHKDHRTMTIILTDKLFFGLNIRTTPSFLHPASFWFQSTPLDGAAFCKYDEIFLCSLLQQIIKPKHMLKILPITPLQIGKDYSMNYTLPLLSDQLCNLGVKAFIGAKLIVYCIR